MSFQLSHSSQKLTFAAFLIYCPRNKCSTEICQRTQGWTDAVKGDLRDKKGTSKIKIIVDKMKMAGNSQILNYFTRDCVLIPIPRSAPSKPGTLWPSLRICQELVAAGFGGSIAPFLIRKTAVAKSAYASSGRGRPGPTEHANSMEWTGGMLFSKKIILIDDVVTRGATFLGAENLLSNFFKEGDISAFAISRTVDVNQIPNRAEPTIDPVVGTITMSGGLPRRRP